MGYLTEHACNIITSNTVSNNNFYGIRPRGSSNNLITGNTFVNDGLFVQSSYQNTVEENIVNGKPLVYLEDTSDIEVTDAGQVILVNCSNITVKNLDLSNTNVGIELWRTEDSIISNNDAGNNDYGIYLWDSSSNNITGNTVTNNNDGIHLWDSSNNNITGNTASNNNLDGIQLWYSSNNTITGNTFVNDGLFVPFSYQNTIEENMVNGKPLVYLEDTSDIEVTDAGQVILVNCNNISVESQNLSNTCIGVMLWQTEDSIISNNIVRNNNDGIYLWSSSSNTISGNNASNNNDGIYLWDSSNNNITGNTASNNNDGITLSGSSNNNITGNTASNNNRDGIQLWDSSNNTLSDNTANSNKYYGIFLQDSSNNTLSNNIANSNDKGIRLSSSSNNTLSNNIALNNNIDGISLSESSNNNSLSNNTANSNNYCGIYLSGSNNIFSNNIASNNDRGIYLAYSCNNILFNNTASNNAYGIYIYSSNNASNNKIYLNNFINNGDNVYSEGPNNIWNSTEKITYTYNGITYINYLGNYWSDYVFEGNDTNGDGIGDTPYSIYGDNDRYPLMVSWENYFAQIENIFDTGSQAEPYPSISGTHNGTITLDQTITVSTLYTYPCVGTGGHTEYARIWNSILNVTATWNGYNEDWHNITFNESFTLKAGEVYNYTILTGSYPQIIHKQNHTTLDGSLITCEKFIDVNGRKYNGWIPAIRLE